MSQLYHPITYDLEYPHLKTNYIPFPDPDYVYLTGRVLVNNKPRHIQLRLVKGEKPLSGWTLNKQLSLSNIVNNASGAAYNPITDSLWVPNNNNNYLYEYTSAGAYKRTVTTSNFSDVEAICWMYDNYFGVIEEDTSCITIVELTSNTTHINRNANVIINPGLGNLDATTGGGLEGVAYNPTDNVFYAVKEKRTASPSRNGMKFYIIQLNGNYTEPWSAPAVLPNYITDLSDVHYEPRTNRAYILSDEAKVIIEADPNTGYIYDIATWPSGMFQPEGLSFSPDFTRMWVVSEPNTLRIYTREYKDLYSHAYTGNYNTSVPINYSGTIIPMPENAVRYLFSRTFNNVKTDINFQDFNLSQT